MFARFFIRLCCLLGAACLLFLLLGACAPVVEDNALIMASPEPLPCRYASSRFLDTLDAQIVAWDHAESTAAQAPSSLELIAPLNELRTIRNQVEVLEAPPCAWNVRVSGASFMSEVIRAYDLVVTGQSQAYIDQAWQTATLKRDYFALDYAALRGESEE